MGLTIEQAFGVLNNLPENVKIFSDSCCCDNSLSELQQAIAEGPTETDLRDWDLSPSQWLSGVNGCPVLMRRLMFSLLVKVK